MGKGIGIMKNNYDNVPKNLDEAIEIIIKDNCENDDFFKVLEMSEEKAIGTLHFTTGRYIRNIWSLWSEESPLYKYFKNLGIFHADDMSGIILTSVHRKMNNKPIKLEEQIKYYQDYWKKYKNV